jgi:5-methylcytosine-specific restriction protein A
MVFDPKIKVGQELSNKDIQKIFKCSPQGGMRKSNQTNTLVLVSDHIKSLYQNRIEENIIFYTGEGQIGDQKLSKQNKTLLNSKESGVSIHFFEVFEVKKYTYIGEVELAADAFQEIQLDINKNPRNVWMFPLKVKGSEKLPPVDLKQLQAIEVERAALVHKMSDQQILTLAKQAPSKPGRREVVTPQIQRNEYVAEHALRRAKGICQLCEKVAPFKKKKSGEPYLEVHHVIWLSKGGDDTIENTVALCPNCHRKMHSLNLAVDQKRLLERVKI